MDDAIKCPKCGSTQITAQKKGFSAGKAVAGVVLTGGVGALAGLHGSSNIEVHCLKCGAKWNPAEQARQESLSRQRANDNYKKAWKGAFYTAYEAGNKKEAKAILLLHHTSNSKHMDMDAIYKSLKADDAFHTRVISIIVTVFLLICFLIIYWLKG